MVSNFSAAIAARDKSRHSGGSPVIADINRNSGKLTIRRILYHLDSLTCHGAELRISRITPKIGSRDHRYLLDEGMSVAIGIGKSALDEAGE